MTAQIEILQPKLTLLKDYFSKYYNQTSLCPTEQEAIQLFFDDNYQNNFLDNKKHNIISIIIFYMKYLVKLENKLITQKQLKEEHSLYRKILTKLNTSNTDEQQEFYILCTTLYLDTSCSKHWNFREKINLLNFSESYFREAYHQGTKYLYLYNSLFTSEDISQLTYKKTKGEIIDIKTKIQLDILSSHGHQLNSHKKVISFLENHLQLKDNIPLLIQLIKPTTILNYQLNILNKPLVNQTMFLYTINNITEQYSLENISKYNTMITFLSTKIHNSSHSYGLDGKTYQTFEDLVQHYSQEPFLKDKIIPFMKNKADKAKKIENRAIWLKAALDLQIKPKQNSELKIRKKI